MDGSQKEWGNFLNLLLKEGGTQKGEGSLRKEGRVPTWRKLWRKEEKMEIKKLKVCRTKKVL